MQVRDVSIAGYRSLRALRFPVGSLTVFVGANGVGKTNLYRSLQLLQAAAAGTLARELASEGGMESALWAGKRMVNKPARIKLAVGLGDPTSSIAAAGRVQLRRRGRRGLFVRGRHRPAHADRGGVPARAADQGRDADVSSGPAAA